MWLLTWASVAALIFVLVPYVYWSWREEKSRPKWINITFYGGLLFFFISFGLFTSNTLASMSVRTHANALTPEVIAGKQTWQKYTCIDCHTILGNGAYYGPDLTKAWDRFVARTGNERSARIALVAFLQNPPRPTADRRGMANFQMPKTEAQQLAAFLQWTSRIDTNGWPPAPARPINRAGPAKANQVMTPMQARVDSAISDAGCMGCHSLGGGRILGPDLKGIASKYDYPTLVQWIRDPEPIYRARGKKPLNPGYEEMPALDVNEQDANAIAVYLLSLGGKEQP